MDGPDFIAGWLEDLGLAQYTESFTSRGFTISTLADWGGAGQEETVTAALAQINLEHPGGILLNEYGHAALFRTAIKKLAKAVAAPKDGIQIGVTVVLTIAGVDDSDDCYGPLKAGDRGKVVDAAGTGVRKSYKVESADKATWWYKADSIQTATEVHSANSVVDALRKKPGKRQVWAERRRQTMESIDSGTRSRARLTNRGGSLSGGTSEMNEEPDLSDLDFLMEDQAALLIQNWFHRFKRRKAGRAELEGRRQAKIESEERKRAEEAQAAQAEAEAQAARLEEQQQRAAAEALATRVADEERLLVEAEAARSAELERLERLAADDSAAAALREEARTAAAVAAEASLAAASAAAVPSTEAAANDEDDAMALLEEMEGLARRNTESLRRFGDADEMIEQYEELIETEGGYIEAQLSVTRGMAQGNMSLPMVSIKLAQMMAILDEVQTRRQAATKEIEMFGNRLTTTFPQMRETIAAGADALTEQWGVLHDHLTRESAELNAIKSQRLVRVSSPEAAAKADGVYDESSDDGGGSDGDGGEGSDTDSEGEAMVPSLLVPNPVTAKPSVPDSSTGGTRSAAADAPGRPRTCVIMFEEPVGAKTTAAIKALIEQLQLGGADGAAASVVEFSASNAGFGVDPLMLPGVSQSKYDRRAADRGRDADVCIFRELDRQQALENLALIGGSSDRASLTMPAIGSTIGAINNV